MLDIVVSNHCMHFQGKLMIQTQKMAKNLILQLILAHWAQNQEAIFFLQKSALVSH